MSDNNSDTNSIMSDNSSTDSHDSFTSSYSRVELDVTLTDENLQDRIQFMREADEPDAIFFRLCGLSDSADLGELTELLRTREFLSSVFLKGDGTPCPPALEVAVAALEVAPQVRKVSLLDMSVPAEGFAAAFSSASKVSLELSNVSVYSERGGNCYPAACRIVANALGRDQSVDSIELEEIEDSLLQAIVMQSFSRSTLYDICLEITTSDLALALERSLTCRSTRLCSLSIHGTVFSPEIMDPFLRVCRMDKFVFLSFKKCSWSMLKPGDRSPPLWVKFVHSLSEAHQLISASFEECDGVDNAALNSWFKNLHMFEVRKIRFAPTGVWPRILEMMNSNESHGASLIWMALRRNPHVIVAKKTEGKQCC